MPSPPLTAAALCTADVKTRERAVRTGGLKPDVFLIDFGIAMFSEFDDQELDHHAVLRHTLYMAPEQLLAKPVAASDVYAFSLLVYEMVCGQPLFEAATPAALYQKQLELSAADVKGIDPALRDTLLARLRVRPEKRPHDIEVFGREIAARLRSPGGLHVSRRVDSAAAAAAACAAFGFWEVRPVSAAEKRVSYNGGQTFREVGWIPFGDIQSDMVELDLTKSRYTGNRVSTKRQCGYTYAFSTAVQRYAHRTHWRATAMVRPVRRGGLYHMPEVLGGAVLAPGCPAGCRAGSRRGGQSHTPVISTVRQDLSFDRESGFATIAEMRYDPARKSVRPLVNGNVLGPENFGFDQFLDYPGVDISVYQLESETGEAVIGDIRFEMA